jgi:hypothetical protein
MPGKQAKILKADHIDDLLSLAQTTRHPLRDRLIVLLSVKPQSSDAGALVGPMRHIYGVSDRVLTMTLSEVLMAAPSSRPNWFETGNQMIAVDTLVVHNFLHRTDILKRLDAAHAYGTACCQQERCADILRRVSTHIDARRFNKEYPISATSMSVWSSRQAYHVSSRQE